MFFITSQARLQLQLFCSKPCSAEENYSRLDGIASALSQAKHSHDTCRHKKNLSMGGDALTTGLAEGRGEVLQICGNLMHILLEMPFQKVSGTLPIMQYMCVAYL
jgi:hypothetical protein